MKIPLAGAERRSRRRVLKLPAATAGRGAPAGRDRNGIFFIKEIYSKWSWRTRFLSCGLPATELRKVTVVSLHYLEPPTSQARAGAYYGRPRTSGGAKPGLRSTVTATVPQPLSSLRVH